MVTELWMVPLVVKQVEPNRLVALVSLTVVSVEDP